MKSFKRAYSTHPYTGNCRHPEQFYVRPEGRAAKRVAVKRGMRT